MTAARTPIPSYAAGFARHAGRPGASRLRVGLRGLWSPALGPTGVQVFDASGHSRHLTGGGGWTPGSWTIGPAGWSVGITGTAHDGDRLSAGVVPGLYPALGSWTVAAVVSFTQRPPQGYADNDFGAVAGAGFFGSFRGAGLFIQNDTFGWQVRDGGDNVPIVAATDDRDGDPHLAVGVLRRGASRSEIWVDGRLQNTADVSVLDGDDLTDTLEFGLGRRHSGGTPPWEWPVHPTTRIYMTAVWGRALATQEIQQLHRDPFAMVRAVPTVRVGRPSARPPYRVPASAWWAAGPCRGEPFVTGPAIATHFLPGMTAGEGHV